MDMVLFTHQEIQMVLSEWEKHRKKKQRGEKCERKIKRSRE